MSSPQPTPSTPLSSTSSRRPNSDDYDKPDVSSPKKPGSPPAVPPKTPAFPSREDCWSEEATRTLIDAWGSHYLKLNRGNLRQKHWQEVADAVNSLHGGKLRRTDVQCKNRIDTTKKKYKIEKSKSLQSNGGRYVSPWPHFRTLDSLIGASFSKTNANGHGRNLRRRISPSPESSPSPTPSRNISPVRKKEDSGVGRVPTLPWSVPVGRRSKRSGPGSVTERNFSVMAAAAAAMEARDDDDEGKWGGGLPVVGGRKRKKGLVEEERIVVGMGEGYVGMGEGYVRLAEAIVTLGKMYERVEGAKQRQMVELEKQRMQFAKDLEIQRMKVFMESQVHLEKLKRNSTCSEDIYWYF